MAFNSLRLHGRLLHRILANRTFAVAADGILLTRTPRLAQCCAVCCCHPLTSGQLYERAVQKGMLKRLPMVSCLTIALILFVLEISQEVTSAIFRQSHYTGGRHPAWPRSAALSRIGAFLESR